MKKISYFLVAILSLFIVSTGVFAASSLYEFQWTNSYDIEMEYYDDIITNDIIAVEEGYLTVGFNSVKNWRGAPCIRLLDHDGVLIKEIELEYDVGKLKRIIKVEDDFGTRYYAFGVISGFTLYGVVLDEEYNVLEEFEYDTLYELGDSDLLDLDWDLDVIVEYYDGNFYVFNPINSFDTYIYKTSASLTDQEVIHFEDLTEEEMNYLGGYFVAGLLDTDTSYPVFVTKVEDGYLYGATNWDSYDDNGAQYYYSFYKLDNNGELVLELHAYDQDMFARDAIQIGDYIIVNGSDENGTPVLVAIDKEGNIFEVDAISNYYGGVDFWGEHLVELEKGFALTGTNLSEIDKPEGEPGNDEPLPPEGEQPVEPSNVEENEIVPMSIGAEVANAYDAKVLYFSWIYDITSETDGNGAIDVVAVAKDGETIRFDVKPNKGFVLSAITVVTKAGEVITFTEDELILNEDGSVSVSVNSFLMPAADVHITANFALAEEVPNTVDNIMLYVGILLISVSAVGFMLYRRNHS